MIVQILHRLLAKVEPRAGALMRWRNDPGKLSTTMDAASVAAQSDGKQRIIFLVMTTANSVFHIIRDTDDVFKYLPKPSKLGVAYGLREVESWNVFIALPNGDIHKGIASKK